MQTNHLSEFLLLPVLYLMSAPVTLWTLKYTGIGISSDGDGVAYWWSSAYAPVLWAAEQHDTLGPITMKPFEWLDVNEAVEEELFRRYIFRRFSEAQERHEASTP